MDGFRRPAQRTASQNETIIQTLRVRVAQKEAESAKHLHELQIIRQQRDMYREHIAIMRRREAELLNELDATRIERDDLRRLNLSGAPTPKRKVGIHDGVNNSGPPAKTRFADHVATSSAPTQGPSHHRTENANRPNPQRLKPALKKTVF